MKENDQERFREEGRIPEKKEKLTLYSLLNPDRDGKGVEKEDPNLPRNFSYYFKLLGRRFSTIFTLNLLTVFGNFPIIFLFLAFAGFFSNTGTSPAVGSFSRSLRRDAVGRSQSRDRRSLRDPRDTG